MTTSEIECSPEAATQIVSRSFLLYCNCEGVYYIRVSVAHSLDDAVELRWKSQLDVLTLTRLNRSN